MVLLLGRDFRTDHLRSQLGLGAILCPVIYGSSSRYGAWTPTTESRRVLIEQCHRHGQHPRYGRHLSKADDKKGQNRKCKIKLWEREIKIIFILLNHRNILQKLISDCIEGRPLGIHVSLEESYFHFSYEAE